MGAYAKLWESEGAYIPEDRIEEFEERVEKLFQASGMMERESVSLFGKQIVLLRKAEMRNHNMCFDYNYFGDDCWEDAGYYAKREKGKVGSGKIGSGEFAMGVIGALFLEEQYTEGTSFITYQGGYLTTHLLAGWINYLFGENYFIKNRDIWKLCETVHYINEYMESDICKCCPEIFAKYSKYKDSVLSWFEYRAVYEGIAVVESFVFIDEKTNCVSYLAVFGKLFKDLVSELHEHKEKGRDESEIDDMLSLMKKFYGSDISEDDFVQMCRDKGFESFGKFTVKYDLPAFAVKIQAENYDMDFWTLWDRVRKTVNSSKRIFPEFVDSPEPEEPVSTKELLKLYDDDMIPYWSEDGDVNFSDELKKWFVDLKERYDAIIVSGMDVKGNKLKWIIDLLRYASGEYCRIYAFGEFFYETLDNLQDGRYLALWKLFDDMLHDPGLYEAGQVIFLADGETRSSIIVNYTPGNERESYRLNETWEFMPREKKFNKARKIFRRYMALVANNELRKKVFGF